MKTKLLAVVALAAGSLLWASGAEALTISVGESVGGGAISTLTSGASPLVAGPFTVGPWTITGVNATGTPPLAQTTLLSNTIEVNTTVSGTFHIFVTEQGLTSPTGVNSFLSSLTTNLLNGSITSVDLATFVDAANGLYSGTQLVTHNFTTSPATFTSTNSANDGAGPFSVTEEFSINATGAGNVNLTIDLASLAVPEPASLALLGSALAGLGFFARRRKAA